MRLRSLSLALAIALVTVVPALADGPPVFLLKFGAPGHGTGQFDAPRGMATDAFGNVYVADAGRNVVLKFSGAGAFLGEIGSPGSGMGQFVLAYDVAVGVSGSIYVSDAGTGRVEVFTADGTFVRQWQDSRAAVYITLDPTETLLATVLYDSVAIFRAVDGLLVARFQIAARVPQTYGSLGFGPDGVLYAVGDNVVKRFAADGTFLGQWGTTGTGLGQFFGAVGLTIDSAGNVYVFDGGGARVEKFTSGGTYLTEFGGPGTGDGLFGNYSDMTTDGSGNIFVLDPGLFAVQKFGDVPTSVVHRTWGELKRRFR